MNMEELGIINDMKRGWSQGKYQPRWHRKVYDMWLNMWDRCRNPNYHAYDNYKDCKIYVEFKYLSKFVEWIISEPRFNEFTQTCDKVMWCIDKDSKDSNNRNYYPECMTLTTQSENCSEKNNRRGTPTPKTPIIAINDNKVLLFKSILDARNKSYTRRCIWNCINKKQKTHKGYKWYKLNYKHNRFLRVNERKLIYARK